MDNTLGVYAEAFYFTKYNYGSTAGFCLDGQTKVACHVPFNWVKCSEIHIFANWYHKLE